MDLVDGAQDNNNDIETKLKFLTFEKCPPSNELIKGGRTFSRF